jgi:galactokinase/mevalonate kinase-like predicted kinase
MFPNMVTSEIIKQIEEIKPQVLGYKLSGAGGVGYIVMFTDKEMEKTMKVRVRR